MSHRVKRQRRRTAVRLLLRTVRFGLVRILPVAAVVGLVHEIVYPAVHRWLLTSPVFRVERVVVSGNRFLTPCEVVSLAGIVPGTPLISVRPSKSESRLLSHPRIQKADVRYEFPRGLRLRVEERLPVALVDHEGLTILSGDGVVLPPVPGRVGEDLPVILPPSAFRREGDAVLEPRMLDALDFLAALEEIDTRLGRSVSAMDLSGARFARVYLDTLDAALLYEPCRDWSAHLRVLPAVIADMTRAGLVGPVLDLRFARQIVRRGGSRELRAHALTDY